MLHHRTSEDIMKKLFLISACLMFMVAVSSAQESEDKGQMYKLTSETLNQQGKDLDTQITGLSKRMADIIKKYELLKADGVRIIPYQTTYILGSNFIEMEKHSFKKEDIYARDVVGIQTRKVKIYTDGQSISKIESEIYDRDYYSGTSYIVRITDPSPMTEGTDDIVFTHIINGKTFLDGKRLGDIKNTTAFPIRNELKRDFLVQHYSYFMNSMLFISEAYFKGLKDAESSMSEFLKKANKY
jgi:hypothetical protein